MHDDEKLYVIHINLVNIRWIVILCAFIMNYERSIMWKLIFVTSWGQIYD
jgi:hypothetical protein